MLTISPTRALFLALCLFASALSIAQSKAKWSVSLDPPDARVGESARVLVKGEIEQGWYLYGMKESGGPTPATFALEPGGSALEAQGPAVEPKPATKFDNNFKKVVMYHAGKFVVGVPVKVLGPGVAAVKVGWQVCNKQTCEFPMEETFKLTVAPAPGPARADRLKPLLDAPPQPAKEGGEVTDEFASGLDSARQSGLISFILFAVTAGLAALLTPCVFPMIPITVSFFSKTSGAERKTNYAGALAYCFGIVSTFTALGIGVTLAVGASGVRDLAANPWVNIFLVLLFVTLAISLFGVFEIGIPAGLMTRLSMNAGRGSLAGPVLMGFTFTLTSFTCTVPFVGTILAGAAATGDFLYPVIGMLAFSSAFALPFFFLALFPQALSKLPKSGSWMGSLKAFMGFIELGAGLKFLSNADQVLEFGYITEPIFLAIWAALAALAAVYLLGWMRFRHEPPDMRIGPLRRVTGIAMFVAAGYCLAAIEGAPLGKLAALLPPGKDKLEWVPSYRAALELASAQDKPIFIDFTGVTCTNCRYMEKNMFPRTAVNRELQKFVRAKLYTDRKNPADLWNKELLKRLSNSATLPVYVIQSSGGKTLKIFQGSTDDESKFVAFMRQGLQAAKSAPEAVASLESP